MKQFVFILPVVLAIFVVGAVAVLIRQNQGIGRTSNSEKALSSAAEIAVEDPELKSWSEKDVHALLLLRTSQKSGVYLSKLNPALDSAALIVVSVYHRVLGDQYRPVITSGNDYPWHARHSRHYENKAVDFRLIGIPGPQKEKIIHEAQQSLSERFRVLWEMRGAPGEHLHLEMRD